MAKILDTNDLYDKAVKLMNSTECLVKNSDKVKILKTASKRFEDLGDYKDSAQLSQKCLEMTKQFEGKKDNLPPHPVNPLDNKKKTKVGKILTAIVVVVALLAVFWLIYSRVSENGRYLKANFYGAIGNHEKAYKMLDNLKDYKDAPELRVKQQYLFAKSKYNAKKYNKKKYWTAINSFRKTLDYKDTNKLLTDAEIEFIKHTDKGHDVLFGEAHWIIVEKYKHKAMLVRTKPLAGFSYNSTNANVTWKTSTIRGYINGPIYMNSIFTNEMQKHIMDTKIRAKVRKAIKGYTTTDKLFFLNSKQAEKYEELLTAFRRDYWLIESGSAPNRAKYVSFGQVMDNGYEVDNPYINIRPAMWINY